MQEIAVEALKLTKQYGAMKAVDEVSFTLESDKIYGLLGRNGAGKTTIMHMLTAQQFPSSGTVKVFGEAPYENSNVLSRICFIKESQKYSDFFHVKDILEIAAAMFPNWDQAFASELVEEFRLPLKRRVKKLSRGMLSSVGIIIGLASRAELTLFDEPYLGLDAVARTLFYDRLLQDYTEYPRTIVLSTHLIDEVSQLLEHVLVIDGGKLLLNEEAEMLRGKAIMVAGNAGTVEKFIQGKEVLERESLGTLLKVTVMCKSSIALERQQAEELGLEWTAVSLQKLMVLLTSGKMAGKAASI